MVRSLAEELMDSEASKQPLMFQREVRRKFGSTTESKTLPLVTTSKAQAADMTKVNEGTFK